MKKVTSLLIDEKADQRIQFYLSLDLLQRNRACVCHDDGFDALAYLKQHPEFVPDYIFFSADLPASQAALFVKHIRKLSRLQSAHVILLSADGCLPDGLREAGFVDCLPKQRDIYQLRDTLKIIFEKDYAAPVPVTADAYSFVDSIAARIKGMINSSQALLEPPRRLSA
jgi:DNA-binding response OmpR family regulator